jgi:hypothetical protein
VWAVVTGQGWGLRWGGGGGVGLGGLRPHKEGKGI